MILKQKETGFKNKKLKLNPLQELVVPYMKGENNLIISSPTGSGKSTAIYMLGHKHVENKKKVVYVGPMKALVEQKVAELIDPDSPWKDYKTAIVTGDYFYNTEKSDECAEADIVAITPEALVSKIRNFKSERNLWLENIGLLCVDECVPPDTLIETDRGFIPIGEIIDNRLDVKVASFNHALNKVEFKKIVGYKKSKQVKTWYNIHYQNTYLTVTSDHKVWCERAGYTEAKNIQKGDIIYARPTNANRGTSYPGNFVGGRKHKSTTSQEIRETTNKSIHQTTGFSRVEVQQVEEISGHPTENHREQRIRHSFNNFQHVIKSVFNRNLQRLSPEREKDGNKTVVVPNNGPSSNSGMVYGRRLNHPKRNHNISYRRVYRGRKPLVSRLVESFLENRLSRYSLQKILCDTPLGNWKGQVVRNYTRTDNTGDGIQTTPKNGGRVLFNVRESVSSRPNGVWSFQETNQMPRNRMFGEIQAYDESSRRVEQASWCCDLEIEGNHNFFANGMLVHNCHLIGEDVRGPNLEAALIEFCFRFPDTQLLALSATIPNWQELRNWFSTLNAKKTDVIVSDYRPVPIEHDFQQISSHRTKALEDLEKFKTICEIIQSKPKEQFLVAVFAKAFGNKLKAKLKEHGIEAEFHNANHTKTERQRIESGFINKQIRVIISTSTLFTGVNLPARNVIVTAATIGYNDIKAHVIQQAAGRAGRVQYDDKGFVYYLIPAKDYDRHVQRIKDGERVVSQMHNTQVLATHFLGSIYLTRVTNHKEFLEWYKHTLAYEQFNYSDLLISQLLDNMEQVMVKYGMLLERRDGTFTLRRRGIISAQMVMDPFHLFDLAMNFTRYFGLNDKTDLDGVKCLGECAPYYCDYVTDEENYCLSRAVIGHTKGPYVKMVSALHNMILGMDVPGPLLNWRYVFFQDADRVEQCVLRLNNESEHWHEEEELRILFLRIRRGIPREQARLSLLKLTKTEINKLKQVGVETKEDLATQQDVAKTVIKTDKLKKIGMLG